MKPLKPYQNITTSWDDLFFGCGPLNNLPKDPSNHLAKPCSKHTVQQRSAINHLQLSNTSAIVCKFHVNKLPLKAKLRNQKTIRNYCGN